MAGAVTRLGSMLLASMLTASGANAIAAPAAGAGERGAPLRDPMQPPAATPVGATTPAGDAADSGPAGAPSMPLLTSIRRNGSAPPRALIDGEWVANGARVGPWRVRAIGRDEVLLQSVSDPSESQRLTLHQLSIHPHNPGSPARPALPQAQR